MKKLMMYLVVVGLAVLATPVFGQIKNPSSEIPTINDPNPPFIPWIITILFASGVISIAMKPCKRHRV